MLHELPITNVRLDACSAGPAQFEPAPEGYFCGACQRVVHDFTQASRADLERVRMATGGRFCGLFRREQLARPPRLRRRLRLFLVAAALVLVQGLSARQAWAQVQQAPPAPARPDTTATIVELEHTGGGFRDDLVDGDWLAEPPPARKKTGPQRAGRRHPAPKARTAPRRTTPR